MPKGSARFDESELLLDASCGAVWSKNQVKDCSSRGCLRASFGPPPNRFLATLSEVLSLACTGEGGGSHPRASSRAVSLLILSHEDISTPAPPHEDISTDAALNAEGPVAAEAHVMAAHGRARHDGSVASR